MIFSGLKLGIANKKIGPLLRNRSVSFSEKPVRSIAVLLDRESMQAAEAFRRFKNKHNVEDRNFSLMSCLDSKPKGDFQGGAFCYSGDLNWKGKFTSEEAHRFMERKFDLLICFTGKETALSQFMLKGVKADLKVGRSEDPQPEGAADISIAVSVEESELFLREVEKYLRIFNKIK